MHFQCPGFRVLTGVGAPADLPSESGDRGQGASVASPVLPAREQPETGGDTRLLLRDGGGGQGSSLVPGRRYCKQRQPRRAAGCLCSQLEAAGGQAWDRWDREGGRPRRGRSILTPCMKPSAS